MRANASLVFFGFNKPSVTRRYVSQLLGIITIPLFITARGVAKVGAVWTA